MSKKTCWRCGKELTSGGLNYVIHIKIFADFDGVILEPEEGIDQQFRRLMDQVEQSDSKELLEVTRSSSFRE